MSIMIKSSNGNYTVDFFQDLNFLKTFVNIENKLFIIDSNIWNLYKKYFEDFKDDILLIDAREESKTLDYAKNIYDEILRKELKKNFIMISVGGGIVQDVSGFVASTIYRGVQWYYVPTTLLAQCDSCIGSKTSINYNNYKNLLGTFFAPKKIFVCVDFIDTLNKLDFYSGLGEILKLHIIGGFEDIHYLKKNIDLILNKNKKSLVEVIKKSLLIKKKYIEIDEFDNNIRNYLNYGHCFGHAIESASKFTVPHGQAVILGIILANRFSQIKNNDIDNLINKILLLNFKDLNLNSNDIINFMKKDKKRINNNLSLIIHNKDLEFFKINNFKIEQAEKVLEDCLNE